MTRAALDARVLEWMRDPDWTRDDARFEAIALDLFAHQLAHCEPYRRFCEGRGVSATSLRGWREIPAVPTGAFKEVALRGFPADHTVKTFRTSGTSAARRGELHLDTLALYEASLLPSFRRGVLPDLTIGARVRIRVLAPSPAELPDSSLSHMFGCAVDAFGDAGSGFDVRRGELGVDALLAALEGAIAEQAAVVLCGTAFAFVHLLDAMDARATRLSLAPGSRALETGGFKGHSREIPQSQLYAEIDRAFGIPAERIVNQYGMCELGSQFYDTILREPGSPRRKLAPPWTRVRIVDPATGADVPDGQVGAIHVYDLANTGSVLAIQTADLGRAIGDGFEVLGREPGAEARGCSIAAEAMLAP
jgi:acyl-CoA synthetase (AMP-forming)/AMP-acid ligase II